MYLLGQDREAENGHQKSQQHNHVMGHLADQQRSGLLEVELLFHQERQAICHTQWWLTALHKHYRVWERRILKSILTNYGSSHRTCAAISEIYTRRES